MFRKGLFAAALMVSSAVAAPAIGTLTAKGTVRVDEGQARGNATLFEGSVVETTVPARMQLTNGAVFGFDANSKGRVFGNHAVLEQGRGAVAGAYRVDGLGMSVVTDTAGRALVSVRHGVLDVAALDGTTNVLGPKGEVLARLSAGESLAFDAPGDQGGAKAAGQESEKEKKKKRRLGGAAAGAGKAGGWAGMSSGAKAAVALLIIGGGVGAGVGIYEGTKSN
ncbi:MAG: hypothetical protein FJW39_32635 [Acidobacteria bacterium]|nr:hypothetical protein [Acidobacteriota bacterium]